MKDILIKIAISGKAQTGKDTSSNLIKLALQKNKIDVNTIAFATPIKEMLMIMFPNLNRKYVFGSSELRSKIIPGAFDKDGNPLTIRRALLDIGTLLGRSYKDDVWLNVIDTTIKDLIKRQRKSRFLGPYNQAIIVNDLRFLNEFNYLKKKEFCLVRIKRQSNTLINHSSETDQEQIMDNEFDFVIDNNKTLKHLKSQVDDLVSNILTNQHPDFIRILSHNH